MIRSFLRRRPRPQKLGRKVKNQNCSSSLVAFHVSHESAHLNKTNSRIIMMSYVYSKTVKSVCLQQLSAVNCSVQQYLSGVFSLGSRYVSAKSIQTVSHCRLRWFQWSAHRLPPNFPRPPVYLSWKHYPQNQSISMSAAWFVKTTGQQPQWAACPLPGGRQQGISGKFFQKNWFPCFEGPDLVKNPGRTYRLHLD